MKKRVVYIMMFLVALLLGGCNLFSGLDKEDLDAPGAFEFKLDDAMANGEYTVVVGLIDSKIASSPTLKAVDDEIGTKFDSIESLTTTTAAVTTTQVIEILKELTKILDDNISKPEVREYINLKVTQAEAYLGEAGLKMTDIVANITGTTSGNLSRSISKSVSTNNFNINKLIPSGLDSEKLELAINSYLKSLPTTTGPAFTAIGDEQQLAYLNASLSPAINAVNRFINVFKVPGSNPRQVVTSTAAFGNDDILENTYKTNWENELPRIKTELSIALMNIKLYSLTKSSLISEPDALKLETDFGKLIEKLETFTKQDYADFTSQAGISIGQ